MYKSDFRFLFDNREDGIMSLVLKIIIFIVTLVVGIIAGVVWRINEPRKTKDERHQDSDLKRQTQKIDISSELKGVLQHRNQLEERIVILIGGKTGMSITWGEIMKWASKGDVENFHCYADTFPEKVKRLKMAYDELKAVIEIEDQKYKKTFRNNELLRECESLIKNSKSLEKILHNGTISKEDLRNWYEKN